MDFVFYIVLFLDKLYSIIIFQEFFQSMCCFKKQAMQLEGLSMEWYAIFVETGREEEVQKFIELLFPDEEIRTLVPKRKLIERKLGKTYETIKTLITGYVLTFTNMSDELD